MMAIAQYTEAGGFLKVSVDHDQIDKLIQSTLSPAAMKRVQTRGINETTAWLKSQLLRQLPAVTGIPRAVLTRRIRQGKAKTKAGIITGMVWLGTRAVDAMDLKDEGPAGAGYLAGGFYFQGGFKAAIKGKAGIYARKGRARLPVIRQKVAIDAITQTAVARLIPMAQLQLRQRMTRLMSWELDKATT